MKSYTARRLVTALAGAAAATAALVAPGVASAGVGPQCSGGPVTGQGANALKIAEQNIWGPGFNSSSDPTACNGSQGTKETPKVTFTSTSSGAGLESWGTNGHAASFSPTNAFIGTEEAPGLTQEEEIEKSGAPATVLTIPVAQEAIAIIVHLPTGCTATSTTQPGRLVFKNVTLEKIFEGKTTEWNKIKDGGDKFLNNGSETCPVLAKKAKVHITRAVREDLAGTTNILKKYFFLISKKAVDGSDTWEQLASGPLNTAWPNETPDPVLRVKGDSGLAAKVATEPGSIGFVSLADARASLGFTPSPGTGGPGTPAFWAPIESGKETYSDPSSDGDVAAKANSNCEGVKYTNGKKKFPPPATNELWNEVTTSVKETNYTICGFAFALALDGYHNYPATTEGEATTVENYLQFNLSSTGQSAILNNDYLPLPTSTEPKQNVLKIAQEGASKVTF
jgi:ABC-type phosphate transport system substrate-binding protein